MTEVYHTARAVTVPSMRRSRVVAALVLLAPCGAALSHGAAAPAPSPAPPANALACTLISAADLAELQKSELVESKGSDEDRAGFAVSQCFLRTADFARSVSLMVTLPQATRPPAHGGVRALSPRQHWESLFHHSKEEDGEEAEREEEEEEHELAAPEAVRDLGDEAYWVPAAVAGALYVLQGDAYLRISAGGPGDGAAKRAQARALALRALPRLAAALKSRG